MRVRVSVSESESEYKVSIRSEILCGEVVCGSRQSLRLLQISSPIAPCFSPIPGGRPEGGAPPPGGGPPSIEFIKFAFVLQGKRTFSGRGPPWGGQEWPTPGGEYRYRVYRNSLVLIATRWYLSQMEAFARNPPDTLKLVLIATGRRILH